MRSGARQRSRVGGHCRFRRRYVAAHYTHTAFNPDPIRQQRPARDLGRATRPPQRRPRPISRSVERPPNSHAAQQRTTGRDEHPKRRNQLTPWVSKEGHTRLAGSVNGTCVHPPGGLHTPTQAARRRRTGASRNVAHQATDHPHTRPFLGFLGRATNPHPPSPAHCLHRLASSASSTPDSSPLSARSPAPLTQITSHRLFTPPKPTHSLHQDGQPKTGLPETTRTTIAPSSGGRGVEQ